MRRPGPIPMFVVALFLGLSAMPVRGQCPYKWADEFRAPGIMSGTLFSMALHDDGGGPAVFVAGPVQGAGQIFSPVAKWTGSTWTNAGSGLSTNGLTATIHSLLSWNDGSGSALYAGGSGFNFPGFSFRSVAKRTGTTWSLVGSNIQGTVWSLVPFDDGSGETLWAAGNNIVGTATLAKLVGSNWVAVPLGITGTIYDAEVWSDGTTSHLYLGGSFTSPVGSNLARYDGTTLSAVGGYGGGPVNALASSPVGAPLAGLYLAGDPTSIAGQGSSEVIRFDGTALTALGVGQPDAPGFDTAVSLTIGTVAGQPRLYVGGFEGTQQTGGIRAWNGTSWAQLSSGVSLVPGTGGAVFVQSLGVFPQNGQPELFVLGRFSVAGGQGVANIARWNGTQWKTFPGAGIDGPVFTMETLDFGTGPKLIAGGGFSTAGHAVAKNLAVYTGNGWSALGDGPGCVVRSLAAADLGQGLRLFAGGTQLPAGGTTAALAMWNGTTWTTLAAPSPQTEVRALLPWTLPNGQQVLIVAGFFQSIGGVGASHVAMFDGTTFLPMAGGLNRAVNDLEIFDDGTGPAIHACGEHFFGSSGGSDVAMWTGSSWVQVGNGLPVNLVQLAVLDDGSGPALFVAGNVGVLRLVGGAWTGTYLLSSGIRDMEVFDDGSGPAIWTCGFAGGAIGISPAFITKHTSSGPMTMTSGTTSSPNLEYHCLGSLDGPLGGRLFVGGFFMSTPTNRQWNIAAWQPDPNSPACAALGSAASGGAMTGDLLEINGSTGGTPRRVNVGFNQAFSVSLDAPPTTLGFAPFVLFGYLDAPPPALATSTIVGTFAFPPCRPGIGDPLAIVVAENIGASGLVCPPIVGSSPAPWTFAVPGIPTIARVALQAVIHDPSRPLGFDVTNGVLLVVGM